MSHRRMSDLALVSVIGSEGGTMRKESRKISKVVRARGGRAALINKTVTSSYRMISLVIFYSLLHYYSLFLILYNRSPLSPLRFISIIIGDMGPT
ncbi:uncharacterized protein G2W53_043649 [Senna tora]|uniref:Uncharacterized protein n=1 Tax=Senna tora TaxID=362788 RepID=A0A834SL29_9FABA|nr:uncharacterized protein G2W53_043649 [Senna tora]